MSDNWGTNHREFVAPPRESDDPQPDADGGQHEAAPSTQAHQADEGPIRQSEPPTPPQWPTTPDPYDDATRRISPDLLDAVRGQIPAPPAQPEPATARPEWDSGDQYAPQLPRGAGRQSAQHPGYPPQRHDQGYQQDYQQSPQHGYQPGGHSAPQQPYPDGSWRAGVQATNQFPDPDPFARPANTATHRDSSSLVDRLSPEVLAPPPKPQPTRGWRKFLLKMTGGLINPGLSTAEEEHLDQLNTIVQRLSGDCYRIGVLVGKGGTGKTTVATVVASILSEYRSDDRVVVVDADPAFGKLANRVAPKLSQTYWELLNDEATGQLRRWTDVKAHLGSNPSTGLWLLRGEHRSKQRRLINKDVYLRAVDILDRYMTIAVIDCGQVLEHPLMEAVLPTLDSVIVVGALEQGAGEATAQTLAWLEDHGYHRLLTNGVVVLNDPRGRATKRTRKTMFREFQSHVDAATVLLPFDEHLSEGMVIDTKKGLAAETRKAGIEITAHLARGFAATTLDGQRR